MINSKQINSIIEAGLKETDIFLVETEIRPGNHIRVFIDSPEGVTIEECAKVSRLIESGLDREIEDFDLEVSSPGLNAPLKVLPQYMKNLGREVDVIRNDGSKVSGKLRKVQKKGVELEITENKNITRNEYISFSDIKSTRVQIIF
jgi:ribosome maturation factor RimP